MITILCSFIQVEFQSKSSSPFDTHYWIMSTFLVALSTYVLAWATVTIEEAQPRATIEAQVKNSNHSGVMSRISHMSGALASVLLLLIILPVLGWVTFLLWTLLFCKNCL
ncbi:hypothetical protein PanWU01x14_250340 [Parasponia andersonii]|uniref:Transmembrane protein n=1 Tax=Parasponia andersonii TaxID=3476 RepID=A0A2P5BCS7_PARAD|nr:hypothetical protein PanWU01x14_250340 [Parasponia andersonii]